MRLSEQERAAIARYLKAFCVNDHRPVRRWAQHRLVELEGERSTDHSGCEGLDSAERQELCEYLSHLRDSSAQAMPGVADWASDALAAVVDDGHQAEAAFQAIVRGELADLEHSGPS